MNSEWIDAGRARPGRVGIGAALLLVTGLCAACSVPRAGPDVAVEQSAADRRELQVPHPAGLPRAELEPILWATPAAARAAPIWVGDGDALRAGGRWVLADERGALVQGASTLWRISHDWRIARRVDLGEWDVLFPLNRTPRGVAFMSYRPASTIGVEQGIAEIDTRDGALAWIPVGEHYRSFSFDREGHLYVPLADPVHYLRRFDGERWEPWGPRLGDRTELEALLGDRPRSGDHLAIVGDEVHVVDVIHGLLVTFGTDGELRRASRLPGLLSDLLVPWRTSGPLGMVIRSFTPIADGGLALTTTSGTPDEFIRLFVIDPDDHSVQPVHLRWARGATIGSQPSFRGDRLIGFGSGGILYRHPLSEEPSDVSRARVLEQEATGVVQLHLCREWVESAEASYQIDGGSVRIRLTEEPAGILERFAAANPGGRLRLYYGSDPIEDARTAWLRVPSEGVLGWHRAGWPLAEAREEARAMEAGSSTCLFDVSEFPRGSHRDREVILDQVLLALDDLYEDLARGREDEVTLAPRRLDLLIHAATGLVGRHSREWVDARIHGAPEYSHGITETCEGMACLEEGVVTVRLGPVTWQGPRLARVSVILMFGESARPQAPSRREWALEFVEVDGEWRLASRIDRG